MKLTSAAKQFSSLATSASAGDTIVAEVLRGYAANRRTARAHTKIRGEVRGGGRKPWRQKGTGRARAGTIRSPLWRGGGITFGPRSNRNYSVSLPAKLRTKALEIALGFKATANKIQSLDKLPSDGKTNTLAAQLGETTSTLILLAAANESVTRAARNIQSIAVKLASQVTAEDVVRSDQVIGDKAALAILAERVGLKTTKPVVKSTTSTTATKKSRKKAAKKPVTKKAAK